VSRYKFTSKLELSQGIQALLGADAGIRVYGLVVIFKRVGAVCKNRDKQLTHIVRVRLRFYFFCPLKLIMV